MPSRRNTRQGARRASTPPKVVPRPVREETLRGLEPEQQRYVAAGAALSFDYAFRGRYLYISARQKGFGGGGGLNIVPLCRLRYEGHPKKWGFEIYRYSRNGYDEEGDFPFSGGSPRDCLAVAADFYLLEYDVLDAGTSREEAAGGSETAFQGEAALLPPLEAPGFVELPEGFPGAAGTSGLDLLADLDAFLRFVEGRTFDLAPRALGFRRKDLIEVNERMGRPAPLHSRPVQSDAPRVQCCFAVSEALGMLRVGKALKRAEATPEVERFRSMESRERLWAVLEAMWQRVHWAALRPRAFGDADRQQAGRCWLGAELGRREKALKFDAWLTMEAEVLEVFLFPFWRDAGLLALDFNPAMAVDHYYRRRATLLRRVEVTGPGRRVFERLSEISPGRGHLGETADPADGGWQGQDFLGQLASAGWLRFHGPDEAPGRA